MSRYPVDRYEHPELHLALRHLRTRQGLTRKQVAERSAARGEGVSVAYLAQCEADPASVSDPKSARTPSRAKLTAMLAAMGTNLAEFEALLAERPWAPVVEAVQAPARDARRRAVAAGAPVPVGEGDEWDGAPAPLWERRREELAELYDRASESQRAELLAFARRLIER